MSITGRFSVSGSEERREYGRVMDAVRLQVMKTDADGEISDDIVPDANRNLNEGPTHKVSLSGSGIAFAHNKLLQPGDRIRLTLTFYPSEKTLKLDAMIVSVGDASGPVSGGEYAARAVFSELQDSAREDILKHINYVRSQM